MAGQDGAGLRADRHAAAVAWGVVETAAQNALPTVGAVLAARPYPGRGLLLARTADGELGVVYFLTGRSEGSRARALRVLDGGDVAVGDTSAGPHDALRHYVAVARRGSRLVVGNGDQVVPIAEALDAGQPVHVAWAAHSYEPDPPICTSRIWVVCDDDDDADGVLGVAKRSARGGDGTDRLLWSVGALGAGTAVVMTTYDGGVQDVRSTAAPVDAAAPAASLADLLDGVWEALDPALRVAALAVPLGRAGAAPLLRA